ncbi:hypothetical protein P3T36_007390 [Kitasatospora sp. MAP12-15]|nr:hypothetical protein [Kitasatospora sp. MAP12-44]
MAAVRLDEIVVAAVANGTAAPGALMVVDGC